MTAHSSIVQRLYFMQVANMQATGMSVPVPCYLVQTADGKNILIDSGLPGDFLPPPESGRTIVHDKDVVEQLAMLDLKPDDIDLLICTHFDFDHAGNHSRFPHTELVVQREHYELARSGYERFALARPFWDHPSLRYRLVDGDTELLPGLELIATPGHTPGHQSVLVRLPATGPVLLAIDAVPMQRYFTPDREKGPMDVDGEQTRASARKLIDLAEREHATLVIFGHDTPQWQTLKKLPEFYS